MSRKVTLIHIAGAIIFLVKTTSAQPFNKGVVFIDGGYGFPNLMTLFMKNNYALGSAVNDAKARSVGPILAKFEYGVSDKIGLGMMVTYADSKMYYTEYGYGAGGNYTLYSYHLSAPRFGVLGKINFHFHSRNKLDPYIGVAAGYKSFIMNYETADPYFHTETLWFEPIPLAVRFEFGAHYQLTKFIGLYATGGLGGPLLEGGMSIRMPHNSVDLSAPIDAVE